MQPLSSQQQNVTDYIKAFSMMNPMGKLFFMASPAWGKTSCLISLFQLGYFKRITYLSPLVSLNTEFAMRLESEGIYHALNDQKLAQQIIHTYSQGFIILTPEKLMRSSMQDSLLGWTDLVVVDEFHLFMLWDNFRLDLTECWYWLSLIEKNVLLLSGTFRWKEWSRSIEGQIWSGNCEQIAALDIHEGKLLFEPKRELIMPIFMNNFLPLFIKILLLFSQQKILVFLPTRNGVKAWMRWAKKIKKNILSCIGGESLVFSKILEDNPDPQAIFSTSVLSHGVNLPTVKFVVILGEWQKDIWQQMKSRGGRRGEIYFLISQKQKWMC